MCHGGGQAAGGVSWGGRGMADAACRATHLPDIPRVVRWAKPLSHALPHLKREARGKFETQADMLKGSAPQKDPVFAPLGGRKKINCKLQCKITVK